MTDAKPLPDQQKLNKSMSNLMMNFTKAKKLPSPVRNSSRTSSMANTAPVGGSMFAKNFDSMNDKTRNALASLLFNAKSGNVHASTSDL